MKKITVLLMALLFLFTNSAFAADNSAQVDSLIKTAEKQGTALSTQLNIKDPKKIKSISSKTINSLSTAISSAKKALKTNKGKQKVAFEKRIKSLDQILALSNAFNAAIVQGDKLMKDGSTFEKSFAVKPFSSEKAYKDLMKQNDVFTKSVNLLSNKDTKYAFGVKYQLNLEITLEEMGVFFDLNKRVESFLTFTEERGHPDVWDEYNAIYESIYEDLSDEEMLNLIVEKFYNIYYDAFIAPEEEAINEFIYSYMDALNAKDAEAIVELYPYETEEDRQKMIEKVQDSIEKMSGIFPITFESVEIDFVYNGEAVVFIKEVSGNGNTTDSIEFFMIKLRGKWFTIPKQTEETTSTNPRFVLKWGFSINRL